MLARCLPLYDSLQHEDNTESQIYSAFANASVCLKVPSHTRHVNRDDEVQVARVVCVLICSKEEKEKIVSERMP